MATATFVKTSFVDASDQTHSIAIVNVDGAEVEVRFWLSLIDLWGKDDTKQYICAEALKQTGNLADAHALLKPSVAGKLTLDKDGKVTSDTRNWQQKWLNDYPIVIAPSVPEVDPLV